MPLSSPYNDEYISSHTCTGKFECTPTYIHKDIRKYRQIVELSFSPNELQHGPLVLTPPRIVVNKENENEERKEEAWTHILQRAEEGWLQRACTSSLSCGGTHLGSQKRSLHAHGHVWRIALVLEGVEEIPAHLSVVSRCSGLVAHAQGSRRILGHTIHVS